MWLALAAQGARLDDVQAVPHLNEQGRAGYRQFLAAPPHRAFAIAPGGAWAWQAELPSPEAARQAALQACQRYTEQRCVPYAVDDTVVFDAAAWPRLWGPYLTRTEAARAPEGIRRGQRFPDLRLFDPKGRSFRLSELRGKVVVVHFWGSWCPHCVHELPDMQRAYQSLRQARDIRFVLVSMRETCQESRDWADVMGLDLPFYGGGADALAGKLRTADGRLLSDRELARVFPTTYVLDKHGVVVFRQHGPVARWLELRPFLLDAAAHSGR
ncbi:MAG: TlpA family protein disulfide reductase [Thiobacillaceae bacterium]|nr:TlpA family protein disulfide reductase [Thiobacillaceae bacterium]MDW8323824.1 TlpA disulfide reductase family protein [Burkholderiales bacterium]